MSTHLGDIALDGVVDFTFTSRDENGAPTTLAGSPAVAVYAGNGTGEITTGITLTVDFDSITGLNHVRIDTSAHASYVGATDYHVVLTAGTVAGISVAGEVIATFSITNRRYNSITPAGVRTEIDNNSTQLAAIVADTNEVQTDLANGGRVDQLIDGIKAKTDGLTFTGSDVKATLDGEEVTTDAASRTASQADVSALALETSVQGLNDISTADVLAQVNASLATYDPPTKAEMDAAFAALNDVSALDVLTQATAALADYDPPTSAEMVAQFAALNDITAVEVRTEIDTNSTQLAAIIADTNEVQTDLANGGRVDQLIDGIKAKTDGLTFVGADVQATLAGEVVIISGTIGTLDALITHGDANWTGGGGGGGGDIEVEMNTTFVN